VLLVVVFYLLIKCLESIVVVFIYQTCRTKKNNQTLRLVDIIAKLEKKLFRIKLYKNITFKTYARLTYLFATMPRDMTGTRIFTL
jgi:hypothetical protein